MPHLRRLLLRTADRVAVVSAANLQRADYAYRALREYLRREPDVEIAVTDLLSDLRHLSDRDGFSLADRDRMAHQNYLAELAEAREVQS